MSGFSKGWNKRDDRGGGRGLGNLFRSPSPIKPQLDRASREIDVLVARLGQAEFKVKSRDEALFQKVVAATQRGDREHAAMLANELSEVRKIRSTVAGAKLALEQVSMRLRTVTAMGDIAATLAPTIAVVKGVGTGLGSLIPGAQGEINEISSLLSETLVEAGTVGGTSLNFSAANDEAERVLEEASAVAYKRMEEQLPEVPTVAVWDDEGGLTA
jgi:division protein CdvB (Snf7/Vps24/ESCRT-III family)